MSDLFYVFGIGLTVLALIVSFLGLRSERFPSSRGLYAVGLGAIGALVLASCAFAVVLAREEADHRAEEVAHFEEEEEAAEEEPAEEEPTDGGEEGEQEAGGEPEEPTADGAAVFADNGCGSCHTLADAGSTGAAGPDLDEALAGQDEAFIETSIVDPSAEVAEGFDDAMPPNFGDQLSADELAALVQYLAEATGN